MSSYVEYEHFRGRYEKRGGAVDMAWNPYVVPGFPCVIFDQEASAFHTVGYLSNVVQSLSLDGMRTAVNYSLSRTIPEMLDLLKNDLAKPENTGKIYGSAPLEPVSGVRDIIQDFTKAEQFYNALFFQRQPMKNGKKASFDFREVIGYAKKDGEVEPIKLENVAVGSSTPIAAASSTQSLSPAGQTAVTTTRVSNLTGERDVVPLKGFVPVFKQYDTAMQYVSRPICTISEYIKFLHGVDTPMSTLTVTGGQVEPGDNRFGNVLYFKRIKRLAYDPDYVPTPAEVGIKTTTDGQLAAWESAPVGAEGASQTRADWDSALVAYQAEMYTRKGPQE
jgi:hypothetical protein